MKFLTQRLGAAGVLLLLVAGLLLASAWGAISLGAPGETANDSPEVAATSWRLKPLSPKTLPEQASHHEPAKLEKQIDAFFGKYLVTPLYKVLFFDFWTQHWLNPHVVPEVECSKCHTQYEVLKPWPEKMQPRAVGCPKCRAAGDPEGKLLLVRGTRVPLVVLWLLAGAVFFTLRMRLINLRGFWHGICLTKGDYDNPEDPGEVSHFQALASALSATVGLGNIAGVAIAVGNGGPGAVFWMIVAGLLGMSSKFTECTLGQMYRQVAPDGTVSGGPMRYLYQGLKELKIGALSFAPLGAVLSILFAVVCMGGSFGGGCTFQVSQSLGAIRDQVDFLQGREWIYGLVMVILVGIVIIGGIRRIAATAEKIVPLMCGAYVLTAIYILLANYDKIGWALGTIVAEAFTPEAAYGGFLGVLVIGIKRAAFSNEAGIGSAAIAHAAARTEHPVREGMVALLEPFIDTVVICTMTGLVIVITGAYNNPAYHSLIVSERGAALTSLAFKGVVSWFPWILCLAVFLFAYSTMISWSYYGERCWSYVFGRRTSMVYRLLFLVFVMLGSLVTATNIKDFSDLMILSMAFPNILGVALLSGKVRRALDDYWSRYKAGEMQRYRRTSTV